MSERDEILYVCLYCGSFETQSVGDMKAHHQECSDGPVPFYVNTLNNLRDTIEGQRGKIERLNDENEQLKADNASLQGDVEWFCIYCREEFATEAGLIAHDQQCPAHPLAHFKAESDRLAADNALLAGKLALAVEANRAYERIHAKAALASTRKRGLAHLFDWFSVS